jgi:hypothetical protein
MVLLETNRAGKVRQGGRSMYLEGGRGRRFGIFMVKNYDNVVFVFILTKQ